MELLDSSDEDECINIIAPLEPLIEENDNGKKYYCMQIFLVNIKYVKK